LNDLDSEIPTKKKGKRRRENRKPYLIYPEDSFKQTWDLYIAIVLVTTCLITPVRIAFFETDDLTWTIINYVIDFFFFIDMIVSFSTCFYDEDFQIHDSRKEIAGDYLRGWFLIDLLSIFPFTPIARLHASVSGNGGNMNEVVRIARLGKIYKLIKLTRLIRVVKVLKDKSKFLRYA